MSKSRMVINYVPGEHCRIAMVEDGRVEEYFAERMDAISRVNNIYSGIVKNVESGIQAAFVDFGIGEAGFLHVSDLHPRYFPGADEDEAERVGKKTPRRERPPIQKALKRGQRVLVQVLKEGVGTKGPTLTSYLSIPGRFLVMMPHMDKVGVSRKVEDEETRRKMRQVLDQLELPDGFGFILRTAGFDRNKTELKRDLAYLQRLWKDLDKRQTNKNQPRLLYAESDLLVRTLRDSLTTDVGEVVIDDEHALARAARFLKIVAPRSGVKLSRYTGKRPIFHAFGLESQLKLMHEREVPLKSGGRLVIDETEAVVAIDVNSGRMRSAKDADQNALKTNMEAVDEICRQIRLRDLGGIVINDLIDMRLAAHRKQVETRFKERLKRDRAKSSIAPISPFGILEMTRQRMRGSLSSQTYAECPSCHGRGGLKRPSAVAAEALRELANTLDYDRVSRVELVVSPRVAGELLSSGRRSLTRVERSSGKHVDVRISDTVGADRYVLYGYDDQGADIAIDRLPTPPSPDKLIEAWVDDGRDLGDELEVEEEIEEEVVEEPTHPIEIDMPADEDADDEEESEGSGKKKRKRRRRRKRKSDDAESSGDSESTDESADAGETVGADGADDSGDESSDEDGGEGAPAKKKRRRRGRRRRGKSADDQSAEEHGEDSPESSGADAPDGDDTGAESSDDASSDGDSNATEDAETDAPKKKRRRRRRGRRGRGSGEGDESGENTPASEHEDGDAEAPASEPTPDEAPSEPAKKKTRRRRKKAASTEAEPAPKGDESPDAQANDDEPKGPRRRSLYGKGRRKLSPSEVAKAATRKDS